MWRRPYVTILLLVMPTILTLPLRAQQKPFTQEQVSNMVRAGLGDDSGAKLIEQRGIDFAPSEDFIQTLKAGGASEAFLNALRAAKPPEPASAKKPLNQVQVITLLAAQVSSHRVAVLVNERGIDFDPTDDYFQEVRLAGGADELIGALMMAKATKLVTADAAAQARQAEVLQHAARGAELEQKGEYSLAEQEYRAALLLDSQNANLYHSLGYVLGQQNRLDDAAAALREALRLNPDDTDAHANLGIALGRKGDWAGAIAEYREALRLSPNLGELHYGLGVALGEKCERDSEVAEYREALRQKPDYEDAHYGLGNALEKKGDLDGAVAEYREALRLNSDDADAHADHGEALRRKGDLDSAIAEYREALRLNPNNGAAHVGLGNALTNKGNSDGAISEYREALRLNPSNDMAHVCLGVALGKKGDRDGAIAEYRETLRLSPNNALAHSYLGSALTSTGKPRVLVEFWEGSWMWKSQKQPNPTTEMRAFAGSCVQSTVTVDDKSADYTLMLSMDVDNHSYGYTLFDHQGNLVGSQDVSPSLTEAAQGACRAVLSNWSAK